jgi:hypothetical protein
VPTFLQTTRTTIKSDSYNNLRTRLKVKLNYRAINLNINLNLNRHSSLLIRAKVTTRTEIKIRPINRKIATSSLLRSIPGSAWSTSTINIINSSSGRRSLHPGLRVIRLRINIINHDSSSSSSSSIILSNSPNSIGNSINILSSTADHRITISPTTSNSSNINSNNNPDRSGNTDKINTMDIRSRHPYP